MRWVANRPDVPPDLNIGHLILVRDDAERAEIYRRIDQFAAELDTANCEDLTQD